MDALQKYSVLVSISVLPKHARKWRKKNHPTERQNSILMIHITTVTGLILFAKFIETRYLQKCNRIEKPCNTMPHRETLVCNSLSKYKRPNDSTHRHTHSSENCVSRLFNMSDARRQASNPTATKQK